MANFKIIFLLLGIFISTFPLFSQTNHSFYLQASAKRLTFNYDKCWQKTSNSTVALSGRVGLGTSNSKAVLATKTIKGMTTLVKTGDLISSILLTQLFSTPDQTIERQEFINTTHFLLGGKMVFAPKSIISIECGLAGSVDVGSTRIGWEDEDAIKTSFTRLSVAPSAALRFNFKYFLVSAGIESYNTHSIKLKQKSSFYMGLGLQF